MQIAFNEVISTVEALPLVEAWLNAGCPDGYCKAIQRPITETTLNTVCEILNLVYGRTVVGWSMGEFRMGRNYYQRLLPF